MKNLFGRNTLVFFLRDVSSNGSEIPDTGELETVVVHSFEQIPQELRKKGEGDREFEMRIRNGQEPVIGRVAGIPSHISWVGRNYLRIDELGVTWQLQEQERCIFDCVTLPAFRGRGIYPATLRWIVAHWSRSDNIQKFWIYCDSGNIPSLRGIQKAGFKRIGTGSQHRRFGIKQKAEFDFDLLNDHVLYR
jgi:RimJ/RimL family protein N-acetyltransferase